MLCMLGKSVLVVPRLILGTSTAITYWIWPLLIRAVHTRWPAVLALSQHGHSTRSAIGSMDKVPVHPSLPAGQGNCNRRRGGPPCCTSKGPPEPRVLEPPGLLSKQPTTKIRSREVPLQTPERAYQRTQLFMRRMQTVQRAHIVPVFKVPVVLILAFFVRDLCKPKSGYCLTFSPASISIEYLIRREAL